MIPHPGDVGTARLLTSNAGVVGGSIEDATGDSNDPIYSFQLAVERVQAAVEAARSLPVPFMLTARAGNLLHGGFESMRQLDKLHGLTYSSPTLSGVHEARESRRARRGAGRTIRGRRAVPEDVT